MHHDVRNQRADEPLSDPPRPRRKVLLPEPYFPLYGPDATLVGGSATYYPCRFEHEFVPQIEDLEALVDEDTVAILYNFPSNPTGGTINAAQRDALLEFARKHDLWIISDEVYDRIIFEGEHVSFWVPATTACSSSILFENLRHDRLAHRVRHRGKRRTHEAGHENQYYLTACPNDAMQYAVLAAIEQASDYPDVLAKEFQARCDLITDRLNAMPGVQCHRPKGSIYVFPKVEVPGYTSEELALEVLKDGVLCSPGTAFGPSGEGHLVLPTPSAATTSRKAWICLRPPFTGFEGDAHVDGRSGSASPRRGARSPVASLADAHPVPNQGLQPQVRASPRSSRLDPHLTARVLLMRRLWWGVLPLTLLPLLFGAASLRSGDPAFGFGLWAGADGRPFSALWR